jgi:multidrug efflux pump subunit AcrA (membrane-fusion protein)
MTDMIAPPHDPIASLYAAEFSPWIRRFAFVLIAMFVMALVVVAFAPWQQNVTGAGRVVAFTPLDRPQAVQAPVPGRVVEVFVSEADQVAKGDPLVRIVDIDPDKITRIEAKLTAARNDLKFRKLNIETFEAQVTILEQARDLAVDAFRAKMEIAQENLKAAEQKLRAARADREFAVTQEKRLAQLVPEWIEEIKLLEARATRRRADAEVATAQAELNAARAGVRSADAQLGQERETASAKVKEARAKMQREASKAAETEAKIADLEGDLRAQNTQLVNAPRDGRVFRLSVNTESSIVRGGEVLLQIVPATLQPAVELLVRGVDAPLIESGRKVRLQFEGWPAVQFIGWPSVAVGTFGGMVSLVDPTDSGNGRFRMLIVQDPNDMPWPDERWLRQGVRAKGWVLLEKVPLWYELWRQLNGFPPIVALAEPTGEARVK